MTTSPFMKLLRSLTMKAAISASSAGRPMRPTEVQKLCIWRSRSGRPWASSVSKMPAAMALTMTPRGAEGRALAREAFGEADDGGLRGGVVDGRGERADGPDGGDVEDGAFALADHLLVDGLGDGEEAVDVGVDDIVPSAVGRGGEVVAAVDGGVVDEDVDAAPLSDQLARHVLEADAVGDGDFVGVRAPSVPFDLLLRLLGEVIARVEVEGHVRALAREKLADGRADAARPARDERALPFEKKAHV